MRLFRKKEICKCDKTKECCLGKIEELKQVQKELKIANDDYRNFYTNRLDHHLAIIQYFCRNLNKNFFDLKKFTCDYINGITQMHIIENQISLLSDEDFNELINSIKNIRLNYFKAKSKETEINNLKEKIYQLKVELDIE